MRREPAVGQRLTDSCGTTLGCFGKFHNRKKYFSSLSFLVKQPGGLGCKLHSKCSKCTLPQSTPSAGLTSICARTITQNHVHVCASAATMGSDKQPNTRGPGAPQLVFAPAGPRPHPRFMGSPSALPPPAPRARRRHLPPRREPPRDAGAQPAGGRSPWAGPRRDHTLPLPVGDPSRGGLRPT